MPEDLILGVVMDELDLIERNLLIINALEGNQPAGIIRLAGITGLPRHKVRYSLRLLENAGIIEATTGGARLADGYKEYVALLASGLDSISGRASGIKSRLTT